MQDNGESGYGQNAISNVVLVDDKKFAAANSANGKNKVSRAESKKAGRGYAPLTKAEYDSFIAVAQRRSLSAEDREMSKLLKFKE